MINIRKYFIVGFIFIAVTAGLALTVAQIQKQQQIKQEAGRGDAVSFSANPNSATKNVNDTFAVDLFMDANNQSIAGYDIRVTFNKDLLEVSNPINPPATDFDTPLIVNIDNNNGVIRIAAVQSTGTVRSQGQIRLGTVTVRAKAAGVAHAVLQSAQVVGSGQNQSSGLPVNGVSTNLASFTIGSVQSCTNLVTNGGFEDGSGSNITGWNSNNNLFTRASGGQSGWVAKATSSASDSANINQEVPVASNTTYAISGFVKTVKGLGRINVFGTNFSIASNYRADRNPNAEWEYLSGTFTTQNGSTSILLNLHVSNPDLEVWFDNISIVAGTTCPTPVPPTSGPTTGPTSGPGRLQIQLDLALTGISGNITPRRSSRDVIVQMFGRSDEQVGPDKTGTLTYNAATKRFTGTVDMGSVANGNYTFKAQVTPQYLRKRVPGILTFTGNNSPYTAQQTSLVVGDATGDNIINMSDFNLIRECYKKKSYTPSCDAADLDDNGIYNDGIDLNLYKINVAIRNGD